MATATYTPIATVTITTPIIYADFTSIPSTYTDLILVSNFSCALSGNTWIRLGNGSLDTGSNYSVTSLYGDGSSASSNRFSNISWIYTGDSGTTRSMNIAQIQNYSNTTTYKTLLARDSAPASGVSAWVGLWRSTSAINTLRFQSTSGLFQAGSTFTLYGIKAA